MHHLVWLDLEMTGLNPKINKIIEAAVIITDTNLNIVAKGPDLVIHQSDEELSKMDEWCTSTHGQSGLTSAVQNSTLKLHEAEQLLLAFIQQYVAPQASPMCGNSIGTDRRFLEEHMPNLARYFHYRNFDVSSFKIAKTLWSPEAKPFEKAVSAEHRAMFDIEQSIAEAKFYREKFWCPEHGE